MGLARRLAFWLNVIALVSLIVAGVEILRSTKSPFVLVLVFGAAALMGLHVVQQVLRVNSDKQD